MGSPVSAAGAGHLGAPAIVLADADAALHRRLAAGLAAAGWRVLEAGDGIAALEVARGARPAVVVAEVVPPALDGLAVCRAITGDPALAGTAVLLLTSDRDLVARRHLLGMGAQGYLLKPFAGGELLVLDDN